MRTGSLDQESLRVLGEWHHRQLEELRLVHRDWAGTGDVGRRAVGDMAFSLCHATGLLLSADSLWRDSDGVSLNGIMSGIHFGMVGRRGAPRHPLFGVEEYVRDTDPTLPLEWTFHS